MNNIMKIFKFFGKISTKPFYLYTIRRISGKKDKLLNQKKILEQIHEEDFIPSDNLKKKVTRLYVCGSIETGCLGIAKFFKNDKPLKKWQVKPYRSSFFHENDIKILSVAAGCGFSIFATKKSNGSVAFYGCGINTDSQLGYHVLKNNNFVDYIYEPFEIRIPQNIKISSFTSFSCGRAHTAIIVNKSKILTYGNNCHGQCGRPIVKGEIYRGNLYVHEIDFTKNISKVICGYDHTLILCEDGSIWGCGLNTDGQIGLPENIRQCPVFTCIFPSKHDSKFVQISSKCDTTLALNDKGQLFGFGNNEYNQFSGVHSDYTSIYEPTLLNFDYCDIDGKIIQVCASGSNCSLLTDKGFVYTWGYGILGRGKPNENTKYPKILPPKLFGYDYLNNEKFYKIKLIDCGPNYFTAINEFGDVYFWGTNRDGQLGLGLKIDQYFPLKIIFPAKGVNVACGFNHYLCLSHSIV
ncbi:RCC1-like G exchanging factor-like protein [Intoshia linei]|uniref:RCC1-like G exchanging factor-like protein n=1 Tax=Intoshia linei TaxID=1819745 RepID=A0A177B5B5_9BILA|nr:RCC1-like G exchanging factor-like protein [Intoshia linei]